MSTVVIYNGISYTIPAEGDDYGNELSSYLIALATGSLTQAGGNFTLSAPVNFGPNFGLLAKYFASISPNTADAGVLRLSNTDAVEWRNAANTANLNLNVVGDVLYFNGNPVATGAGIGTVTNVSVVSNNGISSSVANPGTTPAITLGLGAITPTSVAASGTVTGSNLSGTNTGNQTITLTGDVTGTGTGTFGTLLSTTGVSAGTYTNANITVDAKGRVMSASNGSGGTGTVTSVSVTTANGVSGSVATATTTPAITLNLGAITPTSVAASGTISGSNLSGTNTGNQTITLTGGVTGSGTGSFAATVVTNANLTGDVTSAGNATTLANTTVTPGAYTNANITVDAKGRITSAANGSPGGVTSVSGTVNRISSTGGATPVIDIDAAYVGQTSITTLGTVTTGVWSGTAIVETKGGTNQTTYATGDILCASAANTLSKLPIGSAGKSLRVVAGIPGWDNLTANDVGLGNVTNDAQVKLSTIAAVGDLIIGTGVATVGALTIGTNGKVLTSNGTTASWQAPATSGTVTSIDVSGGTTGLAFTGGPVTTSGTITASGTLGIANGGTGQITNTLAFDALAPTTTNNDLITFNGTNNVRLPLTTPSQQNVLLYNTVSGTMGWSLPTYNNQAIIATPVDLDALPNTNLSAGSYGNFQITGTTVDVTNRPPGAVIPMRGSAAFIGGTNDAVQFVQSSTGVAWERFRISGVWSNWLEIQLPDQASNSGKYLTTNGTNSSWASIASTPPAGSNTEIQFNNAGAFGASSNLTWDGSAVTLAGNLKFSGTARRLTGLMSGATVNDRFAIQNSSLNTQTFLGVLPNGTATQSEIHVSNNSDPTNSYNLNCGISSTFVTLSGFIRGTGTALPIQIINNSLGCLLLSTAGNIILGPQGSALSTSATDRFLYLQACAGTPTGTPTTVAGHNPLIIDSTNKRQYFHNGSSWQNTNTPDYDIITATASQTVFNTTNVKTLANAGGKAFLQVFLNGVKQIEGAGDAYTVTGANQITLNTGATVGQKIEFYGYS